MDNSAEFAGRVVGVLLFACLALYFLIKGFGSERRSLRLANFSLFCGLLCLVMPEFALGLASTHRAGFLLVSGIARVLLGVCGVALAIVALVNRQDGGTGVARPITGGGFSLLHAVAGAGLAMYGSFNQSSTPWVYQSPDGYRLTLPST